MTHKEKKQAIRGFMQQHYDDAHLAALLAHAQSGKLVFTSCCCFIGAATADHALRTFEYDVPYDSHYKKAKKLDLSVPNDCTDVRGYGRAEWGFFNLGVNDTIRRRILIPMIRAEMRRRDRVYQARRQHEEQHEVEILC